MNKKCMFPGCNTSTRAIPGSVLFALPVNAVNRQKWCDAMGLECCRGNNRFVCENHFSLEEDIENFMEYKMMGARIIWKPHVVPRNLAAVSDISQTTDSAKKRETGTMRSLISTSSSSRGVFQTNTSTPDVDVGIAHQTVVSGRSSYQVVHRKWLDILKLQEVDEGMKVCGAHFNSDDFFPTLGEFKTHKLNVKRLKRTAVPSLCLPVEDEPSSPTLISDEKDGATEKSVCSRVSPKLSEADEYSRMAVPLQLLPVKEEQSSPTPVCDEKDGINKKLGCSRVSPEPMEADRYSRSAVSPLLLPVKDEPSSPTLISDEEDGENKKSVCSRVSPEQLEADKYTIGSYVCTTCGHLATSETLFFEHLNSHVIKQEYHNEVDAADSDPLGTSIHVKVELPEEVDPFYQVTHSTDAAEGTAKDYFEEESEDEAVSETGDDDEDGVGESEASTERLVPGSVAYWGGPKRKKVLDAARWQKLKRAPVLEENSGCTLKGRPESLDGCGKQKRPVRKTNAENQRAYRQRKKLKAQLEAQARAQLHPDSVEQRKRPVRKTNAEYQLAYRQRKKLKAQLEAQAQGQVQTDFEEQQKRPVRKTNAEYQLAYRQRKKLKAQLEAQAQV